MMAGKESGGPRKRNEALSGFRRCASFSGGNQFSRSYREILFGIDHERGRIHRLLPLAPLGAIQLSNEFAHYLLNNVT